jgi:hypothetical protein
VCRFLLNLIAKKANIYEDSIISIPYMFTRNIELHKNLLEKVYEQKVMGIYDQGDFEKVFVKKTFQFSKDLKFALSL